MCIRDSSDIIYASKAFLNKEVLRIAEAEGLCLDVSGGGELACARSVAVSYTHLDVYKRQSMASAIPGSPAQPITHS